MIPAPARHAPKRTLGKIRELRAESLMSLNGSGRQVLKQWSAYPNNYYLIDRIELLVRPPNACAKWRCDARNAQPQSSARSRSEPVSGFSPEVDSEAFPRLFHGMPSRRWFGWREQGLSSLCMRRSCASAVSKVGCFSDGSTSAHSVFAA